MKVGKKNKNIGLALVSWVTQNIWRDWNYENGPKTRHVSQSRISAADTNPQSFVTKIYHMRAIITRS